RMSSARLRARSITIEPLTPPAGGQLCASYPFSQVIRCRTGLISTFSKTSLPKMARSTTQVSTLCAGHSSTWRQRSTTAKELSRIEASQCLHAGGLSHSFQLLPLGMRKAHHRSQQPRQVFPIEEFGLFNVQSAQQQTGQPLFE